MNSVDMFSDDAEIQLMLNKVNKNEADFRFNRSQSESAELVGRIVSQPACENFDVARTNLRNLLIKWIQNCAFAHPRTNSRAWHIWTVPPKGSFIFYYTMQTVIFNCEERLLGVERRFEQQSIILIRDFFALLFGTVEKIPLSPSFENILRDYNNSAVTESNAVKTALRDNGEWIGILKDMVGILKFHENPTHYAMFTLLTNNIKTYSEQLKVERVKLDANLKEYACVVCLTKPHDVVFQSCRMCCVCRSCFDEMKKQAQKQHAQMKCPMCRAVVSGAFLLTKWQPKVHGKVIYSRSSMQDVFSLLASLQTHA